MARFANAFYPRKGWLDIQTHYNGTSGDNVPAFRDGASYIFGVAGHAAGFSLCAEHDRQLGGESLLSSLIVAKD